MSDYTKTTDFASKDALSPGNAAKVVKGTEIDAEFEAIETAIGTKANAASAALTGTSTYLTFEIGFRKAERVASTGETAAATHVGKVLASSGAITVPNSVFVAGDAFGVYNNSASAFALTQGSGVTLRWAGTTNTGSRTLAARAFVVVWFNTASEAIVFGSGIT